MSRVRAGCACVDAMPNMRLRRLCELPRGVRALLSKRAVYITSSSSPVSEFMDVVVAVSAYDGGGVSKTGRRGEDVDLHARNVVEREAAIGLDSDCAEDDRFRDVRFRFNLGGGGGNVEDGAACTSMPKISFESGTPA